MSTSGINMMQPGIARAREATNCANTSLPLITMLLLTLKQAVQLTAKLSMHL
jgi:hypothetical protein